MKTKLIRALCVLLTLTVLSLPLLSLAASPRMPADSGAVTDDANVFGKKVYSAIGTYAKDLSSKTEIDLKVVTVHFLDGADVQAYADALFSAWKLGSNSLLLVLACGENTAAISAGSAVQAHVSHVALDILLYTTGANTLLASGEEAVPDCEGAVAAYLTALNETVCKAYSVNLSVPKDLAKVPSVQSGTAQASPSSSWADIASHLQKTADSDDDHDGLSPVGWIVLIVLIMIVFGQSDPARKARRTGGKDYRKLGCGCSPLGWIIRLLGLGAVINLFTGKRRH